MCDAQWIGNQRYQEAGSPELEGGGWGKVIRRGTELNLHSLQSLPCRQRRGLQRGRRGIREMEKGEDLEL